MDADGIHLADAVLLVEEMNDTILAAARSFYIDARGGERPSPPSDGDRNFTPRHIRRRPKHGELVHDHDPHPGTIRNGGIWVPYVPYLLNLLLLDLELAGWTLRRCMMVTRPNQRDPDTHYQGANIMKHRPLIWSSLLVVWLVVSVASPASSTVAQDSGAGV
jgi:hypothetical protein